MAGILPATWAGSTMSLMRFAFGFLFFLHGTNKAFGWPTPSGGDGLNWMSVFGAAAVLELVGGPMLMIGLKTRIVALILAVQMAVAYLWMHVPRGGIWPTNNGGEPALLFCFAFLFFAAAGPDTIAIDKPHADPSPLTRHR